MTASLAMPYHCPQFFERHRAALSVLALLDAWPGAIVYAKDAEGRYVAGNDAMLRAKGLEDPQDYLGRTDRDFHPPLLAASYMREDHEVMDTGVSVMNQKWFMLDPGGRPGWYNSSKVPLVDASGVFGIAGVRCLVSDPGDLDESFRRLSPAIEVLENKFTEPISVTELARLARLSATHFNRLFQQLFRMSPLHFMHALRIDKARRLLADSDEAIADIAVQTGYWDQSHFTRRFKRHTGMPPKAYRHRFRR